MARTLRIATRKSQLALWQANFIGKQLQSYWPEISYELVPMLTSGDKFTQSKLQTLGGKGLFVKELEEALLDKRADLAVHSLKDVPAELPPALHLPVICKRDNPLDALVSTQFSNINDLPRTARIGTSSLRRQSQLLAWRPSLEIVPLRGNINTRLEKLQNETLDAIILAAAGLERLGLQQVIREVINPALMLPACAQGALGIECRKDDQELLGFLSPLNDQLTSACVKAERQVNALLGGNCHVPLAVFCQPTGDGQLHLQARVLNLDGSQIIADEQSGAIEAATAIAQNCAENLLKNGARQLLAVHS
ncbi:porphobilinogen deaminase [Legionella quinlivanii]|uniref:Porphobilinogen deaminase n=2 Tax=Legionella quinlivanii TaxID=45073 RepID=A0A0W0XTX9_9GAMM|nr:porphobilinogen deaminase [Legionella quinlivanii]SEG39708.1 hydroxymethylbilane synthase [Legionella quinlivanii DSM 21216]STY09943.1 porphobilinogen deaminase [Legionella quinlivanii]